MSRRSPQISFDCEVAADPVSARSTAPASCSPYACVSPWYPSGGVVPFGLKIVRHPAGWPGSRNCSGVPEIGPENTCGLSTLPTEPAIPNGTPPYCCSSVLRKKCGQSALIPTFSLGSELKPSVSVCWLTSPSVTIGLPLVSTA